MEKLRSIRGMPDILPKEVHLWHHFESLWNSLIARYGYEEIRLPILESTALFKRSIGEATDIVEKEMFTFSSKDEESLTLRPEGTAGCVRAGLEHGLFYNQVQRLWYKGPMFRYERPQKGRYRQFHQVGVEAFGFESPDMEAEHILMMHRFWSLLGIQDSVSLQINSLGSSESRKKYREKLVEYLNQHYADLDEDSKRRLKTNPLRILDSKNPELSNIIQNAPKCFEHLDKESENHFQLLLRHLEDNDVPYHINTNLVRGLDYYNRTVYEWVTDKLGAQGTICAGGRYDGLVEQLGGEQTFGVGFAIGVERVLLLQQAIGATNDTILDAYLIHVGDEPQRHALKLAEKLRDLCPTLSLIVHSGGGSFKSQFKKADKSGAQLAFILGETELANNTLGIKFLREAKEQISISISELNNFLTEHLGR